MIAAGIDGCRKGWIIILWSDGVYTFGVYEHFSELMNAHPEVERMLIDIPIGLGSVSVTRTVDALLRQELKGRSATVFTPPCRAAAYLTQYQASNKENRRITGKGLSIQAFNICDKIRAVDHYLRTNNLHEKIIESHPELCFKYLNQGKVVLSKKATPEGASERLMILEKYEPNIRQLFEQILQTTLRKDVKKDDVLDAICLCLANRLAGEKHLYYLEGEQKMDEYCIPMKIAYCKT